MDEMRAAVGGFDWSSSKLGPRESWAPSLAFSVDLVLGAAVPMALHWGQELVTVYNDSYRDVLGDRHPEAFGKPMREVGSAIDTELVPICQAILRGARGAFFSPNHRLTVSRSGVTEETRFALGVCPLPDPGATSGVGGVLVSAVGVEASAPAVTDASPKRETQPARHGEASLIDRERQRARFRKTAALGQLAEHVAHDFNNLLMILEGNARVLLEAVPPDNARALRAAEAVELASERGVALTRELRMLSRHKPLNAIVADTAERIDALRGKLAVAVGETRKLEVDIQPGIWPTRADAEEFEVALFNLVDNACEAAGAHGAVTLSAQNRHFGADEALVGTDGNDLTGDFVSIEVRDDGPGIAPDILADAFDPFFTTKDAGTHAGLGLTHVCGFARRCGGTIYLKGQPGRGTIATLFLPRAATLSNDRHDSPA